MTAPEAALVLAKAVDGTPWAFYASRPPTSFRARLRADLAEQRVRLGAGAGADARLVLTLVGDRPERLRRAVPRRPHPVGPIPKGGRQAGQSAVCRVAALQRAGLRAVCVVLRGRVGSSLMSNVCRYHAALVAMNAARRAAWSPTSDRYHRPIDADFPACDTR